MKIDLRHKTAIVTGAGGAIGRAIAVRMAENGAAVAVCDINGQNGHDTVSLISSSGGQAGFYHLDVCETEEAAQVMAQVHRDFGRIDIIPDFCSNEMAEHGMSLLLGISRKLILMNQKMRKGEWLSVRKDEKLSRIAEKKNIMKSRQLHKYLI